MSNHAKPRLLEVEMSWYSPSHFVFRFWNAAGSVMSFNDMMSFNDISAEFRSSHSNADQPLSVFVCRNCPVIWLFVLALALPNLTGCQALQKRASCRSAECQSLCTQARQAREAGNDIRADEFLNAALRQQPGDLETRRKLAETMWNSGRQVEAVAHFAALREQYPNDARLASQLAMMQWETNQRLAASKTATDALALDSQAKEAWLIKARAEIERGELDDALVSYLRLIQVAPDDRTALVELGELHLMRGHPDRACPLFRTALTDPHATPQQKIETEWLLGIAYAKSERWSEAIEVLDRLITVRDSTPDDWCFLGWTHMQSGDLTGAKLALHHAEQKDPDSLAVRRFSRQLTTSAPLHQQVSSVREEAE